MIHVASWKDQRIVGVHERIRLVTYHLGHGEYDGVLQRVAPSRVRRHINDGEKVEDMRATAPTRLNLAHVRRRTAGLYLRNVPREHPEKLFG